MPKRISTLLLALSLFGLSSIGKADSAPQPLHAGELMALVAGDALPANIVHEINVRGLNFRPDDAYCALLKKAGADAATITAAEKANVTGSPEEMPGIGWLQRLSTAKALMDEKRYPEAAQEINAALEESFAKPETGFVMGELLRDQEDWEQAEAIYSQVLRDAPDFPDAHTKLSYILYRLDDPDGALDQAKAALLQNPADAEAHKNAGLALESARKFDASEAEFQEALRLKPDYAAVYFDLGNLFKDEHADDKAITEYQKAITLDPNKAGPHYNLGNLYRHEGDINSAIHTVKPSDSTQTIQTPGSTSALL